jgi:hypothetical protein
VCLRIVADAGGVGAEDDGRRERRPEMLDFTEGLTWFVAGFGLTCIVIVIFFAVLGVGKWSDRDRGHLHDT